MCVLSLCWGLIWCDVPVCCMSVRESVGNGFGVFAEVSFVCCVF